MQLHKPTEQACFFAGARQDILAASALVEESFALLHLGAYEPSDVGALADAVAASPAASTPLGQHLLLGSLLDRLRMLRLLLLPNATCTQGMHSLPATWPTFPSNTKPQAVDRENMELTILHTTNIPILIALNLLSNVNPFSVVIMARRRWSCLST